jgi:glutamate formiminotransferase
LNALFECVPNISEGRDLGIVDACAQAVTDAGARLLHRTSDRVHHRSVLTFAGAYGPVRDAAIAIAAVTRDRIDLRTHSGIHPRMGALDVLPFVPLQNAAMADAAALAREAACAIWERFAIPSFLYGEAATTPLRRDLAAVRKGEFEGLDARFMLPDWRPDYGDIAKHASAGAIAIGARAILIAFNVELATEDVGLAVSIARQIRERSGGLRTLKALGLPLGAGRVQVSLNITDYHATPLYRVVALIRQLAEQAGVSVIRSELIGCLPYDAVEAAALYQLGVTV